MAHGKIGEGIEALPVGDGLIDRLLGRVDQLEGGSCNHGPAWICNRAGNAAAGRRAQRYGRKETEDDHKKGPPSKPTN